MSLLRRFRRRPAAIPEFCNHDMPGATLEGWYYVCPCGRVSWPLFVETVYAAGASHAALTGRPYAPGDFMVKHVRSTS